jgi:hypothetical protein
MPLTIPRTSHDGGRPANPMNTGFNAAPGITVFLPVGLQSVPEAFATSHFSNVFH